ncbi:toprim domain-containing protein [Paraburkholderia sp. J8-2]|uniref:DUF7146 domain-containing protein n=1 Tax=Paraburkholderia sp. J8-2 TaxID=2805440 RepID=UPI002AB70BA7|nr:toprim domain-containing protein [Paraburkholderia sp. J8-2]
MKDGNERVDVTKVDWLNVAPYYLDDKDLLSGLWTTCPMCSGSKCFRIIWDSRKGGTAWYCAKEETGGSGLVSVIHEITGKPIGEIFAELRSKNYNQGRPPLVPATPAKAYKKKSPDEARAALRRVWESSRPITEETPAWTYLSGRIPGLRIEWLGPDLRFHPGIDFWMDEKLQGRFPVFLQRLVAAGDLTARTLQRCFLLPNGQGKIAFINKDGEPESAKKEMASPAGPQGGSIRLNTCVSRRVALTEGAENGLAVVAKYENRIEVRSMLNCGNLEKADLDWSRYDEVIIYADRDSEKRRKLRGQDESVLIRAGEHHAGLLAARLRAMGKTVRVIAPIKEGMDFCDVWKLQYERRLQRLADRAVRREERERQRHQAGAERLAA